MMDKKGLSLFFVSKLLEAVSCAENKDLPCVTLRGEIVTGVKVLPGMIVLCTETE